MIASEVERVRAPDRASETAAADFLRAVLSRELGGREEILARAARSFARARRRRQHDRRPRPARRRPPRRAGAAVSGPSPSAAPGPSSGARSRRSRERDGAAGAEVLLLVPGADEPLAARAAEGVLREMRSRARRASSSPSAAAASPRIRPTSARGQRGAARRECRRGRLARGDAGLRADRRLPPAAQR